MTRAAATWNDNSGAGHICTLLKSQLKAKTRPPSNESFAKQGISIDDDNVNISDLHNSVPIFQ